MNERTITTKYRNGDITVVWQPQRCTHSGNCARGLPTVFHPSERPWIEIDGASSEAIVEQVKKCPSGALSYYMNDALSSIQSAEEEND